MKKIQAIAVLFVGLLTLPCMTTTAQGADDAHYISQTVPTTIRASGTATVSVVMQNTGTTTWTEANGYRLGSQNPQDNGTWGPYRVYLSPGETVPPGAQKTFTFTITAPATVGDYPFQWRMLRESVNWFGEFTPTIVISVTSTGAPPPASAVGQWSAVTSWPLVAIHAHLLPTGKVMVFDRNLNVRLWDPAVATFSTPATTGYNLFCSGHAFLGDGRLFIAGGHIQDGVGVGNASLYDATTNAWLGLSDMNAGRWYPTITTLGNGDMLVVSGDIDNTQGVNAVPQVFQATSQSWRNLTNAVLAQDLYPFMHVAPNGKVLNTGPTASTRYLDTSGTGTWTFLGNRTFGSRDYGSSVMYDNGKILVVGGGDPPTKTAEVIDLNLPTPTWRAVSSMIFARRQLNAAVLPDGKVFVTGGTSSAGFNDATNAVLTTEMWDPATEAWTTMAGMQVPRLYHSTTMVLPDGRVLSAGGGQPYATGETSDHLNAEIYCPPYLFKGARPSISSAPTSVTYGQSFFIGSPDATSIAQVTWLRLASVTHAFDQNQRFSRLSFSQAAGGLNVTAPLTSALSPPGHYMLFLLNATGVPSEAKIIQVGAAPASNQMPTVSVTSPVNGATFTAPANITVTANASDTDGTILEVDFYNGTTLIGSATTSPYSIVWPNVPAGSYSLTAKALDNSGANSTSTPVNITVTQPASLAAPSNLTALAISPSQINLTWIDNSASEDGFKIEQSDDGQTFTQVAIVGPNTRTYSSTNLTRNKFYYYRIRAYNSSGNSGYSKTVKERTRNR